MLKLLTAEQARQAEEAALREAGLTTAELMQRAGSAVAEQAARMVPEGRIVVLAGGGNNGGDGWVAARVLSGSGRDVKLLSLADPERLQGEARDAANAAISAGVEWATWNGSLPPADLIVDALLGFGGNGAPRAHYADAIRALGHLGAPVLSVDVPSGVDADSGATPGEAVRAAVTLTFTAPKAGLEQMPGLALAGQVLVADIGVPREALEGLDGPEVWEPSDLLPLLPLPKHGMHKYSRGRLLLVAGSAGMTGAAVLAATGALRTGAGYVTAAVPLSIADEIDAAVVPAVILPLPEGPRRSISLAAADVVLRAAKSYDAVALGPGVAVDPGSMEALRRIAFSYEGPLLLDAGGLSAMEGHTRKLLARQAPTVITPHPGELSRLLGVSTEEVQSNRLVHGVTLSGEHLVCLLKGDRTVISGEGRQVVNVSGNPGMATAGSGDVLSGMIGSLLAQRLPALQAAALGAYLHGRAGDDAAGRLTTMCITAEDIRDAVPAAVKGLLESGATTEV